MKEIFNLLSALLLILIGGAAMAEKPNLRQTEIGMDLEMTAAEAHLFVNGVPLFDPAAPLAIDAMMSTTIPVNQSFAPGQNILTAHIRLNPDDPGFASTFRINLGYWETETYPLPFSNRPMAGGFDLRIEERAGVPVEVMEPVVAGQPYMTAASAERVAGTGVAGTWNTYEITFDVGLDLPPEAWRQGQMLAEDAATAEAVVVELRRTHTGLAGGREGTMQALGPLVVRHSAAIGVTPEELAAANFPPFFGPDSGFELLPFDPSKSRLQLFGGGQLATFVPIPLQLYNEETDETATLYVYYWKDAAGRWQVIH